MTSPEPTKRVALVTGATSGIGRATALALGAGGYQVVAVGRDPDRGADVAGQIGLGEFIPGDLSSIAGVERLAAAIRERHDRLHVLVNNAGVNLRNRQTSPDGIEQTFAINTVAPFLLAERLLDPLAAAQGRVVNVVTELFPRFRLTVDDLENPARYSMFRAYSRSKLALAMVTIEQARRYAPRGVTAVGVHPGIVPTTRLGDDMPAWLLRIAPFFARLTGRRPTTAEGAAAGILWAATGPVESGTLYADGKPMEPPRQARDEDTRIAVRDLLEGLTGSRSEPGPS